jgi:hypothetical protein
MVQSYPPSLAICGCYHIFDADITHDLFALLKEAPELFFDEIQEWLAVAHDTRIS